MELDTPCRIREKWKVSAKQICYETQSLRRVGSGVEHPEDRATEAIYVFCTALRLLAQTVS